MLRLVCGLGTAAVDRRTGSYPRMVALDKPSVVWQTSSADRHQFSQRLVDVVSDGSDGVENWDAESIRAALPPYLSALLYSHDRETETILREQGIREDVLYVSCEGLVNNRSLMRDMGEILRLLQDTYAYPVDIEYTINCASTGEYVISLLQCRPPAADPYRRQGVYPGRSAGGGYPDRDRRHLHGLFPQLSAGCAGICGPGRLL